MTHLGDGGTTAVAGDAASGIGGPTGAAAPGAPGSRSLDRLPVGTGATVVRIEAAHRDELAVEGLRPGTRIDLAAAAPLGGPLVVSVGRARVAVARSVARTIHVTPASTGPDR